MAKSILAYFKSENDAESARIRLQSLRVNQVFLDNIPEEDNRTTFNPIFPSTSGSPSPGVAAVDPPEDERSEKLSGDGRMTHLIEAEVQEEDYEKAMTIIKESNGYASQ